MLPGIAIVLVFLAAAAMMVTRRMPALVALPVMAVAIGLVAGVSAGLPLTAAEDQPSLRRLLFQTILTDGAHRLAAAMMYAIFGAILSQVVMRQGIAQRIVRVAAEYAGDRKLLLAAVMTLAVAVNFTVIGGLGAVIMLGSLVLPILMGSGLSSSYCACLMLFGISLGGIFNLTNLGFFMTLLHLDLAAVRHFALGFGALLGVVAVVFLVVEGRKEMGRYAWAALDPEGPTAVPFPALLTPLVPLALLIAADWPIIPAFLVGILYGLLTTAPARLIPNLTAAILEGLKDISPVLGLFIGIGMAMSALMDPTATAIMAPFLAAILPTSAPGYVVFFTLLTPLTLYRGPLNLFGLGAGFASLMSGVLPPAAVASAFMAVGQVQSVCDPTNTANVWLAQFGGTTTENFLKKTLPYLWVYVLVCLIYAVGVMGVMAR